MLVPDLLTASTFWGLTVPPLKALRLLSFGWLNPRVPTTDLSGKLAVVTGANRGLGLRTSLHLAEMGATVILACRSVAAGETAKQGIVDELQKAKKPINADNIKVMELDLLSMQSVRNFVDAFKSKYKKLDRLVTNAGVSEPGVTKEGYSITFTANHIGHYLLVDLLYPIIRDTQDARVVVLSSVFHKYGDWTKWEESATGRRGDTGSFDVLTHVYADSKLANMLHSLDLRKRFEADGSSATAIAVHPGNCRTDLWRYVPHQLHAMFDWYMRVFFLSPEQGCHTSIAAAVVPLEQLQDSNGQLVQFLQPYFDPLPTFMERAGNQIGPFAGWQKSVAALPDNLDAELQRLRSVSKALVEDLSKRQTGELNGDPSAKKALHPVDPEVYFNVPKAVPIRY